MVASGANSGKEMAIRKRIASIFNKRVDDFPSSRDYNDYLEEVEDMTFNLIQGTDVAAIQAKISHYEEQNSEQIINARARQAEELAAALAASKPASTHLDVSKGATTQSSQTSGTVGGPAQYAPAMLGITFGQPQPTSMSQPIAHDGGFDNLAVGNDDEETMRFCAERSVIAGGWSLELSKRRVIEEAFGSMWI